MPKLHAHTLYINIFDLVINIPQKKGACEGPFSNKLVLLSPMLRFVRFFAVLLPMQRLKISWII